MAWTTPTTYDVGATASGDLLNAQLRDNETFLASGHPQVKLRLGADQSITNNTLTAASFTTFDWNVGPMWASASGSKIVFPEAGIYRFHTVPLFAQNTSGYRYAEIRLNGAATANYPLQSVPAQAATNTSLPGQALHGTLELALTTADYAELVVRHTAGAAINLLGAGSSALHPLTNLSARWVSS